MMSNRHRNYVVLTFQNTGWFQMVLHHYNGKGKSRECVCVCVCVCEGGREGGERGGGGRTSQGAKCSNTCTVRGFHVNRTSQQQLTKSVSVCAGHTHLGGGGGTQLKGGGETYSREEIDGIRYDVYTTIIRTYISYMYIIITIYGQYVYYMCMHRTI